MPVKKKMPIPDKTALALYASMLKIRRYEETVVRRYPEQEMRTPVHLYIGQEAIAAGVSLSLTREDTVFTTHRSHGVYLAKGGDMDALTAELYGRTTGCSKGKGGSMHVVDPAAGVCGTTAIVAGNIPIAVGAALSYSIRKLKNVAVAFFGDGAADEGVFYESLNFAALKKLPVIFVCENNFFATHSHQSARQPLDNIFSKAGCFGMPGERVDGNDVVSVYEAAKAAIGRARRGKGPSLIECRTYRWKTHVGPESDEDLGFPPKEFLHKWIKRCPLKKMKSRLVSAGVLTHHDEARLIKDIDAAIERSFSLARQGPYPTADDLEKDVVG
jgi:pyruvate dehydrogenase E1 component alpha subunit